MFVNENDKLVVRNFLEKAEFVDAFKADFDKYEGTTPFVTHFRIATHGTKTLDNVHPFYVHDKLAFCHNGIISIPQKKDDTRSDTRVFNDRILKQLPHNFIRNKATMLLIQDYITSSKLVFMNSQKQVFIANQKYGDFDESGRWFSNSSYKSSHSYYGSNTSIMGYMMDDDDNDWSYGEYTRKLAATKDSGEIGSYKLGGTWKPTPLLTGENNVVDQEGNPVQHEIAVQCFVCLEEFKYPKTATQMRTGKFVCDGCYVNAKDEDFEREVEGEKRAYRLCDACDELVSVDQYENEVKLCLSCFGFFYAMDKEEALADKAEANGTGIHPIYKNGVYVGVMFDDCPVDCDGTTRGMWTCIHTESKSVHDMTDAEIACLAV